MTRWKEEEEKEEEEEEQEKEEDETRWHEAQIKTRLILSVIEIKGVTCER